MLYNVNMNLKCKMVLCSDSQSLNSRKLGTNDITTGTVNPGMH